MKVIANSRQLQGTGASRRLRRAGRVPGIVYGGSQDAQGIDLDHNALYHSLRVEAFHSSILDLEIDGTGQSVLLRDVQWHPYKRQVMHIDFQRVQSDAKVTLSVPLHFVNQDQSPAIKVQHAVISHVLTEIEVSCMPRICPSTSRSIWREMSVEHPVHLSNLKLPAGVESVALSHGQDTVVAIASIKGGSSDSGDGAAGGESA
ncbi:MAG: 50S ribosomal protein L25/general stress protein Ctc [Burkholderiaceae bacterium]